MPRSDTPPGAARELAVLAGPDAVTRTEQVLCGDGVTANAAAAEGLAATGVRAASITSGSVSVAAGTRRLPESCIHHTVGALGCASAAASGAAFVLSAVGAQDAVDQCLLGHMLSARLGRPGLCAVAEGDSLQVVELPRKPGAGMAPGFGPGDPEPGVTAERLMELAASASDAVGSRGGHPVHLVERVGPTPAQLVLAGTGKGAAAAAAVAAWMRAGGHPVASLCIGLLHPFPGEKVRAAIRSDRVVVAVEEPGAPGLAAALAGTLGPDTKLVAVDLPGGGSPQELAEAIRAVRPAMDFETRPRVEHPGRLQVLPAGTWAEESATTFLGVLARATTLNAARRLPDTDGVAITWDSDEGGIGRLAIAAHPAALTAAVVGDLPAGAAVVIPTVLTTQQELVRALDDDVCKLLLARKIRVGLLPRSAARVDQTCGAALMGLDAEVLPAAAASLRESGETDRADRLEEGARSLVWIDPDVLGTSLPPEEVDFRAGLELPLLPRTEGELPEHSPEHVRHFHQHGRAPLDPPGEPLKPLALMALATARGGQLTHPALVMTGDDGSAPVGRVLATTLEEASQAAGTGRTFVDNTARLVFTIGELLGRRPLGTPLAELSHEVARTMGSQLGLSPDETAVLDADLVRVAEELGDGAKLFDLRPESPVFLLLETLNAVRGPRRSAFGARVLSAREKVADLLRLDRLRAGPGGDAKAFAKAVGAAGSFFDPVRLAVAANSVKQAPALDTDRRQRLEQAYVCLDSWLSGSVDAPPVLAVVPPSLDLPIPLPQAQVLVHPDPMAAAVGVFDGLSRRILPVLRAARVADLETGDGYRPEDHDDSLANLEWEGLGPEEMALLPSVVVIATGTWLRTEGQTGLAQLLRSSRPVLVLVLDEEGALDPAGLSGFHGQLGWLAVGYREALVVQAPLARPCRLVEGLSMMASATRPAVGVVSVPPSGPSAWQLIRAEAGLNGRSSSGLVYDPDGGDDWADRLDVHANPQPERDWPVYPFVCQEDEEEVHLDLQVTHAHALALDPLWRDHFRVIGRTEWAADQLPLSDYLERLVLGRPQAWIPYILVHGAGNKLRRAILTRELAVATLDRRRAWRVLQELAGYDNAFANRAAKAARQDADAAAEQRIAGLVAEQNRELERVKAEEARVAMERLATLLMDGRMGPLGVAPMGVGGSVPVEAPASQEGPDKVASVVPEAVVEDEPISFDDPYIDTPMCTSCNECTNINSQLFLYDENKQAYIGDAAAGTFADLVKAAEQCPAKCIHPGKPRAGDTTASDDMVQRAAAL
jgi:ferredoxin